jgi:hypothetical protein
MLTTLSKTDRAAKTCQQIERVDEQLTKQFLRLPAEVVHREVAIISEGLLAKARFTDHVAVLTGRFAAEHLKALDALVEQATVLAVGPGPI